MNAIVGFSDLLNQMSDNESIKDYTNIIVQNADSLLSLIDNIITVSRMDSEQIKIKTELFNVNKMLNDIYVIHNNKIKKSGKNINILLKMDDNQIIESDPYKNV